MNVPPWAPLLKGVGILLGGLGLSVRALGVLCSRGTLAVSVGRKLLGILGTFALALTLLLGAFSAFSLPIIVPLGLPDILKPITLGPISITLAPLLVGGTQILSILATFLASFTTRI